MAQLEAARLAIGDMPTGFAQTTWTGSDEKVRKADCQKLLNAAGGVSPAPVRKTSAVRFEESSLGPSVDSRVSAYRGDDAQQAVDDFRDAAGTCSSFTRTSEGTAIKYTVGALSMPSYGDSSAAARVTGTAEGMTAAIDVVLIRVSNGVTVVTNTALASTDTSLTQQMANRAVTKLKQAATGQTPTPSAPPTAD